MVTPASAITNGIKSSARRGTASSRPPTSVIASTVRPIGAASHRRRQASPISAASAQNTSTLW